MRTSIRLATVGLALAASLSPTHSTLAQTPRNLERSARQFVQRFYDLVVTTAYGPSARIRAQFPLDPELDRLLKQDEEESNAFPGEIAGLDFDPFAAGNDIATKYEVGQVVRKGDRFFVDVFKNWTGMKREDRRSHAIELSRPGGRWTIMNVHYDSELTDPPARTFDLISTLKLLQEERRERATSSQDE